MIRKNILAIALMGIFGWTHAAEVENLRTISYLNEPLRLQADVVGEGEVILAAPTEYLRLNHPIPSYDLSINIVEHDGKKQVVLTSTEDIESPALTLLLESRDENNRRQLFELPIILDFKPDNAVDIADSSEIVIDGVDMATGEPETKASDEAPQVAAADAVVESTEEVTLAEVPKVEKTPTATIEEPKPELKLEEKPVEPKVTAAPKIEPKPDTEKTVADAPAPLIKRYGPVAKGETLWSIANKVRPANVTPQAMIKLIKDSNPSAFTASGVLRANVTLIIPSETEKVSNNFVTDTIDTEDDGVRIGFIYELPAPPVQATSSEPVAENTTTEAVTADEPTVKVVHPISNNETVASASNETGFEVIAPEAPQLVAETITDTPAVVETPPVETVKPEKAPEVAKPVKKPIVYYEEPDPEPSIVEMILDNIMYIGAGALALIVAVLAMVAVRRRKQGGDQPVKESKAPKAKKAKKEPKVKAEKKEKVKAKGKGLSLFSKKKKTEAEPESIVDDVTVVAAATAGAEVLVEEITTPVMAEAEPEIAAPQVEPVVKPTAEPIAEPIVASVPESSTVITKNDEPEMLDFDLSFDDNVIDSAPIEDTQKDAVDALDFNLPLEPEALSTTEVPEKEAEDYDALDFDLSSFATPETTDIAPTESNDSDYDSLDFTFESVPVDSHEDESSFGENNPLFAVAESDKNEESSASVLDITSDDENAEPLEYISFTDLLDNAEDSLTEDGKETVKPDDFSHLLEDKEAGLANLMAISENADKDAKLDLSFIAEPEDLQAGVDFLESLDLSDNEIHDDPIDSSVKDNVTKSDGYAESLMVESDPQKNIETAAMPDVEEVVIDDIDLPDLTIDLEDTVVEHELNDIDLPTVATVEPEIVAQEEIAIVEPEIAVQEEAATVEPEVPVQEKVTLVEPVIQAAEPVTVVEPVIVEKVVTIEKPVIQEVEVAVAVTEATDKDYESEQVKLELAIAYMGFDKSLAKPLLAEVLSDGNAEQVAQATELMAQVE